MNNSFSTTNNSLIDFDKLMEQLGENAVQVPDDDEEEEEQEELTDKQLSCMLRREAERKNRNRRRY